jgi:hypothetical protein
MAMVSERLVASLRKDGKEEIVVSDRRIQQKLICL